MHGSLAPGVDFLRIRKTTQLYRGMKPHYGVSFTIDGRASSIIDGGSYTQTPGAIHLKQPGQLHSDVHRETPGTYQLVSFGAELIEASRLAMDHGLHGRLSEVQVHPRDERLAPLRRLHEVILAGATDRFVVEAAVAEAVAAFTSFLAATPRSPRLRPSVGRAREFQIGRAHV